MNIVLTLCQTSAMFHIGDAIKRIRDQAGRTQEEIAKKAGIRQNTMSDLERRPMFARIDTLEKVAAALDLDVSDLYLKLEELKGNREPIVHGCQDPEHGQLKSMLEEILHDEHWGPNIRGILIALHRAIRDRVKPTLRKTAERKVS